MEYAVLLRGINVGGKNKVVMSELREQIEAMPLGDEAVHFGENAVFWGKFNEAEFLKTAYHKHLLREDFYRQVTIRSGATVERIASMLSRERRARSRSSSPRPAGGGALAGRFRPALGRGAPRRRRRPSRDRPIPLECVGRCFPEQALRTPPLRWTGWRTSPVPASCGADRACSSGP